MHHDAPFTPICVTAEHTVRVDDLLYPSSAPNGTEPSEPLERVEDASDVLPTGVDIFPHPIHFLPTELLNEIFQHCGATWDDREREDVWNSLDPRLPPWTLSRVCQRWRAQVLDSPNLWSYLAIKLQNRRILAAKQDAERISLLIERRRCLPLSVEIVGHRRNIQHHPALPVLLKSMKYWKQLLIHMTPRALQCFSGQDLPLLRQVYITKYIKSQYDVSVDLFSSAPRLCHVELTVPNPHLLQLVSLPLNRLMNVECNATLDEFSMLQLSQMTALRRLDTIVDKTPGDLGERKVFLPHLSELLLWESETAQPGAVKEFFELLVIRQLASLSLRFHPSTEIPRMHFPAFSSPTETLLELCIESNMSAHAENTENLLHFLSLTPNVTDFYLIDRAMNKRFVLGMMEVAANEKFSVLPRLRILNIDYCWRHDDLPYSDIWAMLELRCLTVARDQWSSVGSGIPDVVAKTCRVETLRVPRWLYHRDDERWRVIRTSVKVVCGFEKKDMDDSLDVYYDGYRDE